MISTKAIKQDHNLCPCCKYFPKVLKIIYLCRNFLKTSTDLLEKKSETCLLSTPGHSFRHFNRNFNWYQSSVRCKTTEKWSNGCFLSFLLIRGKYKQPNNGILPVQTPQILFQYIITPFNLFMGIK